MRRAATVAGEDVTAGLLAILPAAVAVVPFGLLLGAAAGLKGLSPVEMALMSALVFAGSSQFVAVDLWTDPASWAALGLATFIVNLRFTLMSASLGRKLAAFSPVQRFGAMFFLADEVWAVAERRANDRVLRPAFLFAAAGLLYVNWLIWTVVGCMLGGALGDPAALGFDFAFAAMFIGLVIGFWRGPRTGVVIAASAVAAVGVHAVVPGPWYVLAGAAAGCGAAALIAEEITQ
jgi:4-azaleucine resistance transporter AzlC